MCSYMRHYLNPNCLKTLEYWTLMGSDSCLNPMQPKQDHSRRYTTQSPSVFSQGSLSRLHLVIIKTFSTRTWKKSPGISKEVPFVSWNACKAQRSADKRTGMLPSFKRSAIAGPKYDMFDINAIGFT